MSKNVSQLLSVTKINSIGNGKVIYSLFSNDKTELALHYWSAEKAIASVFYVHGIQSHAGWLDEIAAYLKRFSINLFALDRRGSGLSKGLRGDICSTEQLLNDYNIAFDFASAKSNGCPIIGLGQSFGGSILAALLVKYRLPFKGSIFCAPALGQQRAKGRKIYEGNKKNCLNRSPLMLSDLDYTNIDRYLRFMANDVLMQRFITDRTQFFMSKLEDIYCMQKAGYIINHPVFFVAPRVDPIINLSVSKEVLKTIAPSYQYKTFETMFHYIEFSEARHSYFKWLINTINSVLLFS
ncbi:serine aminopeptidase domain-containing protein [Pleurocapsa sp. PCC 7319]|uniref:serine aminopeptidase domain-containing protein n=1 Tax=Pleurocapsa sp. PCC 7319 TaxID=118161 RepID=UPI00034AF3D5|nr:alpha/beta hydrolase [Pleurocapsa sp. PCC 7319]